jgi:hypothetical protein
MTSRSWLGDFEFSNGAVLVKKTGARVPVNREIAEEVFAWFQYFFAVRAEPLPATTLKVYCPVDRPRPWYLIWPVLRFAGARYVKTAAEADLVVHFDDKTQSTGRGTAEAAFGRRSLNAGCHDVSKSVVAAAFERAFGYSLALDPRTHIGEVVEKGEENGVHDGRVVICPTEPKPGKVYQRLIDAVQSDGLIDDLRTPTIGGIPQVVFIKRRPTKERFTNHNSEVFLRRVEEVFSADELAAIGRFCAEMKLDWGGLDILRDKATNKIYIVDANKTDMGPPTALPIADKMAATRIMAHGLTNWIKGGLE